MSATADRIGTALGAEPPTHRVLDRADGLELLGEVAGSGYEQGAMLVRRPDGQMVQLGPLLYGLLEELDGRRDAAALADAMSSRLGRACAQEHVEAIADKLAEQGLLAGSEANAPRRSNPLLALRWKVVITDPALTRRITRPFTWLFRPWVLAPVLVAFAAAAWFVLVEQGVASGFAQAFARPELILLLFGLGVAAAAFHEVGHAAACRVGGGTPGAMGAGLYVVWPAFYTDVTDSYRLPRRDRLRTDLGGLYFNAIVAVATLAAWFVLRVDALLLLIGLQLVEMVKQLSPIIRADGYHVLADATGVPDLYAHIGPTLRALVPGRPHEPSALTGRARIVVTLWVLAVVPLLLAIMAGAILLLPKVAASTWESGGAVLAALAAQVGDGRLADGLVSVLRLLGLALPALGVIVITRRLAWGAVRGARSWSAGHPGRRALVVAAGAATAAFLAWSWWPAGQYEPIRASDRGTLTSVEQVGRFDTASARTLVAAVDPTGTIEPGPADDDEQATLAAAPEGGDLTAEDAPAPVDLPPGTHVAISLVPEGGASTEDPALLVIEDPAGGGDPVVVATDGTSPVGFAFPMPAAPGEDDSQALAVNRTDGGVVYEVSYSLVTVRDGDDVDQRNEAYAFANCTACTTVAVSFQVVLVVGSSAWIAPVNIAEALNGNCPQCLTAAIATQVVRTVGAEPSEETLAQLDAELQRLAAADELEGELTPQEVADLAVDVQRRIDEILTASEADAPAEPDATAPTTEPETPPEEPVAGGDTSTDTAEPAPETGDAATTEDPAAMDDPAATTEPVDPATSTTTGPAPAP